jgi:hypothetical protein
VSNFAAVGARSVIVSGVVDPARGVEANLTTRTALMPCRLRADRAELRDRLLRRGSDLDAVQDAEREAAIYDARQQQGLCVDTTGRSPRAIAQEVVRHCGGLAALAAPHRAQRQARRRLSARPAAASPASMPVLFLCGVTGVGKSTVGFEIYMRDLRDGRAAGYVDAGQLGFCHAADAQARHAIKVANLAAVAASYQAAGARQLIVTGALDTRQTAAAYAAALPAADITLVRLHAGQSELARRIRARRIGGSWPEPGDALAGQSPAFLDDVAARAAGEAGALEAAGLGIRIETDGRGVTDAADLVIGATGWPGTSLGGTNHQAPPAS